MKDIHWVFHIKCSHQTSSIYTNLFLTGAVPLTIVYIFENISLEFEFLRFNDILLRREQ